MAELLPSARMIYLVRNPVERMRSQFLHQRLLGEESDPVERALRANPSYLDFSRYAYQLDQYLDVFPREQVLVLVSEELRSDRANAMARVYRFLGLGEESPPEVVEQEFHRTAEKRVLRPNFEALHRLPGYTTASRLVPGSVRQATLRWRTRGIDPSEAEISEDLRRELEAELAEDVASAASVPRSRVRRMGDRLMNVLHVVDSDERRGGEVFAADLVRALDHRIGQRVFLLRRHDGPTRVRFDATTVAPTVPQAWDARARDVRAAARLRREIASWKPDIVQSHGGDSVKIVAAASVGAKTRVIHRWIGAPSPKITRGVGRVGAAAILSTGSATVAVSDAVRCQILDRFWLPIDRVVTIPNAVDPARVRVDRPRDLVRKDLSVPE